MLQKTWPLLVLIAVGVVGLALLGWDFGSGKPKTGEKITLPSGLEYIDEEIGDGEEAKKGDTVYVHYTGTLADNGKQFDSSKDKEPFDPSKDKEPFKFTLGSGGAIEGWHQGIAGMKVGGKRKLMIPAKLGYGEDGAGEDIPPNADLVFETELVKVEKGPGR